MKFGHILTVSLTLFAIIDILGSIPILLTLRQKLGHIHSEKATLVSAGIMILFLFVGESILKLIGIDTGSFALAGAIVIFIIAMEMILGIEFMKSNPEEETGSIVPIAFPLIAGAGTLTTLISLKAEYSTWEIIIGIIVNLLFVYLVLKNTGRLEKLFGKAGIGVLRRVFGVLLLAIAIKLFKNNLFSGLSAETLSMLAG
ncbi:MarC family protein [Pontibacter sp. G13]|uniref:MarC family protein n=1 Tax=Pontibacter sp. G13 TaxID=3074898 RepID=UPI002889B6EE|nr:MarC family protein [Pontibacter sp. G13]WNJ16977.1 MarC family protein [Pontibacter sp. G13]